VRLTEDVPKFLLNSVSLRGGSDRVVERHSTLV
jgi:hypothetical protein